MDSRWAPWSRMCCLPGSTPEGVSRVHDGRPQTGPPLCASALRPPLRRAAPPHRFPDELIDTPMVSGTTRSERLSVLPRPCMSVSASRGRERKRSAATGNASLVAHLVPSFRRSRSTTTSRPKEQLFAEVLARGLRLRRAALRRQPHEGRVRDSLRALVAADAAVLRVADCRSAGLPLPRWRRRARTRQ